MSLSSLLGCTISVEFPLEAEAAGDDALSRPKVAMVPFSPFGLPSDNTTLRFHTTLTSYLATDLRAATYLGYLAGS